MKKLNFVAVAYVGLLAGCASVVSTNDTARVPVPSIASSDSLADIEIKELVRGQGCVTKTLGFISSGDKNFLSTDGKPNFGVIERAKAAATYNALSKEGLSTDILVNPVWEIHNNDSIFVNDVCARVVGYRGVIKGFKQLQTVTRAPEYKAPVDAPIEKRATNSHFAHDTDEVEREVVIQQAGHSGGSHEEVKHAEGKQVQAKGEESAHGESKTEESAHGESKAEKKTESKKSREKKED